MRRKIFAKAVIWAFTLWLSGCGTRYPSYYKLSIAPTLKSETPSPHAQVTVAVQRFETPAYLRQGRIVYSKAPGDLAAPCIPCLGDESAGWVI